MKLLDIVKFYSGQPQFRVKEAEAAPLYYLYSQVNLEDDLCQSDQQNLSKWVRTSDEIDSLTSTGDILFSLISGQAVRVGRQHQGFFYTQNYVKLVVEAQIDSQFLVYLLNEHPDIRKQLKNSLQGSQVLKYSIQQLRNLVLPRIPDLFMQKLIGEIYFKQQKIRYLKQRCADAEQLIRLEQLRKVSVL